MENLIPVDIYKDPLKKNDNGFGFLGCMMQTPDKDKVQCHICGKLFGHLGFHVKTGHKITSKEYREKFGLAKDTSLTSKVTREKLLAKYLEIPEETRLAWREKGQASFKKLLKAGKLHSKGYKWSLEYKNKHGSCPDQILDQIKQFKEKHGRVPSIDDFVHEHPKGTRYVYLAKRTFGSWAKAIEKAGMEVRKSDTKGQIYRRWDKESLIDLLQTFTRENGRIPRYTDLQEGELPTRGVFVNAFGSLEKAREEAGVYNIII
jgi:hypothetical protein